ncbi:MAG: hypothetical protein GFH27_549289n236 [Chloroflexi bacterium AL-W]|nr:hypothetical protein [Chloroflexi bacterium AL-N1]NOK66969.1 hypothetical protein [Chloroflexi bacterium AL-N10]NOK74739.1 hypothetical protein [Chloroflexi bacterium AL-N5]NOK81571.1 hypothetical protein [Chloroflexi bacterium AL-W]NOK89041.1 hypothetical protein [Chloroflexi bacterium AL-N15]
MYGGNGNGNSYTNPGGFRIKPMYVYIGIAVVAIIALYFITQFLNTSLVMHFGVVAGALLLLANLRELLGQSFSQRSSTALLNCLIGGALVCAWLSQIAGVLFWVPALILLGIAVPLSIGRASVYSTYVQTARGAVSNMRRAVNR